MGMPSSLKKIQYTNQFNQNKVSINGFIIQISTREIDRQKEREKRKIKIHNIYTHGEIEREREIKTHNIYIYRESES